MARRQRRPASGGDRAGLGLAAARRSAEEQADEDGEASADENDGRGPEDEPPEDTAARAGDSLRAGDEACPFSTNTQGRCRFPKSPDAIPRS